MDALEVARRRLHNQHLSGVALSDPVAVVRHLGCVQAQEYAVARWAVGQRCAGVDDDAVRDAVDAGRILRTHIIRPTWHFVAPEDIRWIQAATAPRVHRLSGTYYRMHGLDDEMAARTAKVIASALRGGNHLTRPELAAVLAAAGLPATGNHLAYVVMRAELDCLIVNGPMRGKQHTYALLDERVPDRGPDYTPDEALAELTRRFFTSHGPATVKDFASWSSLTLTQIRHGLSLVGPALESVTVDGRVYWFAPSAPPPRDPSPTAHVLPIYDEYVQAYSEGRLPIVNVADRDIGPANLNMLAHPLVLDSQLIGYWRRTVTGAGIEVTPTVAVDLSDAERAAIEAAFARYGAFAGATVTVAWPARAT
ncbi:winged helix DNA-binding domain-containing protein [Luedemannella flava]|uniref:Winged helix DNA-binding domain-containing protein n=1 Tax=Luedemannella flava TaxID=349316 RepID=A0ABP4YHV8_9ACTN